MHVHSIDVRKLQKAVFAGSNKIELARLLHGVFSNDVYASHIHTFLGAALSDDIPGFVDLAATKEDVFFLRNICANRSRIREDDSGRHVDTFRSELQVTQEYDFLARQKPEWNLCQTINYLQSSGISPRKRVAILTSVRNEGTNLLEWIAYYRILGVDSFFIYKNDNDDGSDELLHLLAKSGIVTVVHNEVALTGVAEIQHKIFEHALQFVVELWDHEWVFFVDPDEFLVLAGGINLPALINMIDQQKAEPRWSGVSFNWKWFGSDRELRRGPGLTIERYTRSKPSTHVKTLARLRDVTGFRTAHFPRLIEGSTIVDGDFRVITNPMNDVTPAYQYGQLNHYWNKSFEEFLVKSMRGKWDREVKLFFEWGNLSPGALDPLPENAVGDVKLEIERLMGIAGIREQADLIEHRFKAVIESLDQARPIERLYVEAQFEAEREIGNRV